MSSKQLVQTGLNLFQHFAVFYQLQLVRPESRMQLEITVQFNSNKYHCLDFQVMELYCRFVYMVFLVNWLLSPVMGLPLEYNNYGVRNSSLYNENLFWNAKHQTDLNLYLMLVYICYLCSTEQNGEKLNDK